MNHINRSTVNWMLAGSLMVAGVAGHAVMPDARNLTGAQEVPPVQTVGSGVVSIVVADDGSVSGSVATTGVLGTAAHVHLGAMGVNGPVIIPLAKTAVGLWSVPPGVKLNAVQFQTYREGGLYVNVHTDANKDGEVRVQLMP